MILSNSLCLGSSNKWRMESKNQYFPPQTDSSLHKEQMNFFELFWADYDYYFNDLSPQGANEPNVFLVTQD